MLKTELDKTFWKFAKPAKLLIRPALETLLNAMRNKNTMGTKINTLISKMLGSIHRYGSTWRIIFFTELPPLLRMQTYSQTAPLGQICVICAVRHGKIGLKAHPCTGLQAA
jgi:hypothetical protein